MTKKDKRAVDYSPSKGRDRCGACIHFEDTNRGYRCELVKGEIDPQYWCKLFKRQK